MEKLGIVFSGKAKTMLLLLLGIWTIFLLGVMCTELLVSYINGTGFDTSPSDTIGMLIVMFMPYLLFIAFMLRSLTAKWAFSRRVKHLFSAPEYQPPNILSPAEAGLLQDASFSLNEVAATLKDFQQKQLIAVQTHHKSLSLVKLPPSKSFRNTVEQKFYEDLFENGDTFTISAFSSNKFLEISSEFSSTVREMLVKERLIAKGVNQTKFIRAIINILLYIFLFMQIILMAGLITKPHDVLSVTYPRYPIIFLEPLLMLLVTIVTITISISGFWANQIAEDKGLKNWQYVSGLRSYLETVYKPLFGEKNKSFASEGEYDELYPYAIALGVEQEFARQIKHSMLI